MDIASQHVVLALDAFRRAESQLLLFGHRLFSETGAHSWNQPHGIHLYSNGSGLTFGFSISRDSTKDRGIVFEIHVLWDTDHWSVRADVDDEDGSRDQITVGLWQSPEIQAATLDELVSSIQTAVDALIASVSNERVVAYLATVERRTPLARKGGC